MRKTETVRVSYVRNMFSSLLSSRYLWEEVVRRKKGGVSRFLLQGDPTLVPVPRRLSWGSTGLFIVLLLSCKILSLSEGYLRSPSRLVIVFSGVP